MANKTRQAYGTWPSPISPAMVAENSPKLSDVRIHRGHVYWLQSVPREKNRLAIMRHDGEGLQCVLPRPLSARSRVHEYGGGAYTLWRDQLLFVLADDQRLYRCAANAAQLPPEPLSEDDPRQRFGDLCADDNAPWVYAVREYHAGDHHRQVHNALVRLHLESESRLQVIHDSHDFYSSPTLSSCGRHLAWLAWDHPHMPWDRTHLYRAVLAPDGGISRIHRVDSGDESLFQPAFSPRGTLYVVSDRSNWWNLYRIENEGCWTPIAPMAAECGLPLWNLGASTYGFIDEDTIAAIFTQAGRWQRCTIAVKTGELQRHPDTLSAYAQLHCAEGRCVAIGASAIQDWAVYDCAGDQVRRLSELSQSLAVEDISQAQSFQFPSGDAIAHGLFYPPQHRVYESDEDAPPVMVLCHGGPTGASEGTLNLKIQFWTSRGFAVADINYRGSTGYGRDYRRALHGQWGVFDVDDACAALDFLVSQGWVDGERSIIKGSSAGGYTALAALAFRRCFRAGVSLYGIGDLERLVADTHKFEAHYLDSLIGPYPEAQARYRQRSPIHAVRDIHCPVLVFQGLLDQVVPANQAETLVEAVAGQGLPVAYVRYDNEAHGFRAPENIQHMLEAEWQFYTAIFQLNPRPDFSFRLALRNFEE